MDPMNPVPMNPLNDEEIIQESNDLIHCECTQYASQCSGNDKIASNTTSLNNRLKKFEELQNRRLQLKARTDALEMKRESRKRRRYERKQTNLNGHETLMETATSNSEMESKFANVKKYLDVNAHLTGAVCHNIDEPKSHLEEKVQDAIDLLDLETAEKLSDTIAQREFACRLHDAFEAKKFAETKEKEAEIIKAKKMRTLHWGFDAKQRWEMKGNL